MARTRNARGGRRPRRKTAARKAVGGKKRGTRQKRRGSAVTRRARGVRRGGKSKRPALHPKALLSKSEVSFVQAKDRQITGASKHSTSIRLSVGGPEAKVLNPKESRVGLNFAQYLGS